MLEFFTYSTKTLIFITAILLVIFIVGSWIDVKHQEKKAKNEWDVLMRERKETQNEPE